MYIDLEHLNKSLDQVEGLLKGLKDRFSNMSDDNFATKHKWIATSPTQPPSLDIKSSLKQKLNSQVSSSRLQLTQKLARVGVASVQDGMLSAVNRNVRSNSRLTVKRVKRDIRPLGSDVGVQKETNIRKSEWTIVFPVRGNIRISLQRLPHTLEYRDRSKWETTPTQLSPQNWRYWTRGKAADSIHKGSHDKFARYAVTSINVLGQNVAAGRKGSSREFQGIGFEPIGVPQKWGASKQDYSFFRRQGYPGHREGDQDQVTRNLRFPIYTRILKNEATKTQVLNQLKGNMVAVAKGSIDHRIQSVKVQIRALNAKI